MTNNKDIPQGQQVGKLYPRYTKTKVKHYEQDSPKMQLEVSIPGHDESWYKH